jgi:hypothetical protein
MLSYRSVILRCEIWATDSAYKWTANTHRYVADYIFGLISDRRSFRHVESFVLPFFVVKLSSTSSVFQMQLSERHFKYITSVDIRNWPVWRLGCDKLCRIVIKRNWLIQDTDSVKIKNFSQPIVNVMPLDPVLYNFINLYELGDNINFFVLT